jgi:hypothetical protein
MNKRNCDFCGQNVTQDDMCKQVGCKKWRVHFQCLQTLQALRKKQKYVPIKFIERSLKYIILWVDGKTMRIYQ